MKRFRIYDLDIEVPDHLLSPTIERGLEKGWYERDEVEIARARLAPGDRVLELGAGLGITALVAAKIVGSENVMAFEANPELLDVERRNASENSLPVKFSNFVLMPETRLPKDSLVRFSVEKDFWASSISDAATAIAVPSRSLEAVLAEFHPNVLIMDIEGYEVDLIEAADLSMINKFIFEIHYAAKGRSRTNAAVDLLIQGGCEIDYQLCHRGVLYLERRH
jgi:FkbM family methyltransferase